MGWLCQNRPSMWNWPSIWESALDEGPTLDLSPTYMFKRVCCFRSLILEDQFSKFIFHPFHSYFPSGISNAAARFTLNFSISPEKKKLRIQQLKLSNDHYGKSNKSNCLPCSTPLNQLHWASGTTLNDRFKVGRRFV